MHSWPSRGSFSSCFNQVRVTIRHWIPCIAIFNLANLTSGIYDNCAIFLLAAFGMETYEEPEERTVVVPGRRVRFWYLLFGAAWCVFSFVMLIDPHLILGKAGWAPGEVDGALARLLAAVLLINGAVFFSLAYPDVYHFYSIMCSSAACLCLAISVALIFVTIRAEKHREEGGGKEGTKGQGGGDLEDDEFRTFNLFLIGALLGMGGIWMYCKGFSNALNNPHDNVGSGAFSSSSRFV